MKTRTASGFPTRLASATLSLLLVAATACSEQTEASPTTPTAQPAQLAIGTVTHFGQGWPAAYLATIDASAAPVIRDGLRWKQIETSPGRYTFDAANSGFIEDLCKRRRKVLIVLGTFNPAYEDGLPVRSPGGMAAFANYAGAVADRFGNCLAGIEIGNEVNGAGGRGGAATGTDPEALVALLRGVRAAVKPRHPDLPLIGISVHSVAIGYMQKLFEAGALDLIDGVAVHPYRRDPTNVDVELTRLRDMMARHGRPVPIWVTEFGIGKRPPHETAVFMAKMAALMSSAGIANAQWYAQVEEPAFPGMGLYDRQGRPTEMAVALNYLDREVFSRGPAVRLHGGETDISIFTFGNERTLVWGEAGRAFSVEGSAIARDVTGKVIAMPKAVSAEPFVLEGRAKIVMDPRSILADSLLDYGRPPWTYLALDRSGRTENIEFIDTRFGSHLGDARQRVTINQVGLLLRTKAANPPSTVFRYTASDRGKLRALACLRQTVGQPVVLTIMQNERLMGTTSTMPATAVQSNIALTVEKGDRIDFVVASDQAPSNVALAYRFRIAKSGDSLACPELSARGEAAGRRPDLERGANAPAAGPEAEDGQDMGGRAD